jgi:hypothetical protein
MHGRGIAMQPHAMTAVPSTLLLHTSLVERSNEIGVHVAGSNLTMDASVVRDTAPNVEGLGGRGLNIQVHEATLVPSTLLFRNSLVERSLEVGVLVDGASMTAEASIIRDTRPNPLGLGARGLNVQVHTATGAPSTLLLSSSIIEQSQGMGAFVLDSQATIDASVLRDTTVDGGGQVGDGVVVMSLLGIGSGMVTATRIDRSARAGLAAHGVHVSLKGSALTCQAFDLDTEPVQERRATIEDLGGNACGCPDATEPCKAVSSNLEAPAPLEPEP